MKKLILSVFAATVFLVSCKVEVSSEINFVESKNEEIPLYSFPDLWQLKRNNEGFEPIHVKDFLTDHIYIKPVDYERNGSLCATFTPVDGEYQWIKKVPGGEWEEIPGEYKTTIGIKIPAGESEVQYALRHTWYEYRVYTNVCTIKVSDEFSAIGMYAYSDGKCSSEFSGSKKLLGIVCEVDENGAPIKFVDYKNLSENNLQWCSDKSFSEINYWTSATNGSCNWEEIKFSDPEGTATEELCKKNYPAFYECSKKSSNNFTWFIPSRDELSQICWNKDVIDESLKKLPSSYGAQTLKGSGSYWSSTACKGLNEGECSWSAFMGAGNPQMKNTRTLFLSVRAVASFISE